MIIKLSGDIELNLTKNVDISGNDINCTVYFPSINLQKQNKLLENSDALRS